MKTSEFITQSEFEVVHTGEDKELSKVFCCDLLSLVISKNPENSVWVTVMGNVNTIAVCVLTDGGMLVLAENANLDKNAMDKAVEQNVTVLRTSLPVFDAALKSHNLLNGVSA